MSEAGFSLPTQYPPIKGSFFTHPNALVYRSKKLEYGRRAGANLEDIVLDTRYTFEDVDDGNASNGTECASGNTTMRPRQSDAGDGIDGIDGNVQVFKGLDGKSSNVQLWPDPMWVDCQYPIYRTYRNGGVVGCSLRAVGRDVAGRLHR